jgi:hypothetical protein
VRPPQSIHQLRTLHQELFESEPHQMLPDKYIANDPSTEDTDTDEVRCLQSICQVAAPVGVGLIFDAG